MSSVPVTIGLPVYNGEKFLRQSLDSILNQNFQDFDLDISDNTSTDSTWDICTEYAAKDSRIRATRNVENEGAFRNFKLLIDRCRTPYFMWWAHDDFMDSTYVSNCYQFLQSNSDYVICCSRVTLVDTDAKELFSRITDQLLTENEPLARIQRFLENRKLPIAFYGLIRMAAVKRSRITLRQALGADELFVAELSLAGKIYQLPQALLFRRAGLFGTGVPEKMSSSEILDQHYQRYHLGQSSLFGANSQRQYFPLSTMSANFLTIPFRTDFSYKTKIEILKLVNRSIFLLPAICWDILMILYTNPFGKRIATFLYEKLTSVKNRVRRLRATSLASGGLF